MKLAILKWILPVLPVLMLWSCQSHKSLDTVDELQLEKYAGKWYEIARLPNRFERGLKCVTAEYSIREDGKVGVLNKGREIDNPENTNTAEGVARVPNAEKPGQLKVQFFWPFSGDYYVIELDEDYQYALVGSPSRKYLWILAREKEIPDAVNVKLTEVAGKKGFETDELIYVDHDCDEY